MQHVDCLSRSPVDEPEDTLEKVSDKLGVFVSVPMKDQVLMLQMSDEKLKRKIQILQKEKEERSAAEKNEVQDYELRNGRLLRRVKMQGKERLLYVIPDSYRKSIVVKGHDLAGHFSLERTMEDISKHFWFPRMKRYVTQHIRMCFDCLLTRKPSGKKAGELHPIPPGTRPFELTKRHPTVFA